LSLTWILDLEHCEPDVLTKCELELEHVAVTEQGLNIVSQSHDGSFENNLN
jgi:hypothetical protein